MPRCRNYIRDNSLTIILMLGMSLALTCAFGIDVHKSKYRITVPHRSDYYVDSYTRTNGIYRFKDPDTGMIVEVSGDVIVEELHK